MTELFDDNDGVCESDVIGPFPVSASSLDRVACPLAMLHKAQRDPAEIFSDNDLSQFGRDVHAIFDFLNRQQDEAVVDDMIDDAMRNVVSTNHETVRWMAMMYSSYFPMKYIKQSEVKLALDVNFKPVGFDDPAAVIRSVIDVLLQKDEILYVCDHKTSWRVYSPDDFFQLKFYIWMLHKHFPNITKIGSVLHFPRKKHLEWGNKVYSDFTALDRVMRSVVERAWMTPVDGKACSGKWCQYCPWPVSCPLVQKGPAPMIYDLEEAKRTASELAVLEVRRKDLQKRLKTWVTDNGKTPIEIGEGSMYYGFGETVRYVFDIDDFLSKLEEWPDLKKHLSIVKSKALFGHPAGFEGLTKKITTPFGVVKGGYDEDDDEE
jgi:hypothetical protein